MLDDINKAKMAITNYHAPQLKEVPAVNDVGRSLFQGRRAAIALVRLQAVHRPITVIPANPT